MKQLLTILILGLTIHYGHAQGTSTIKGKVIGPNSIAIPFASVVLENTVKGVATKNDGSFIIDNIIPGEYFLKISSVGFIDLRQHISLEQGETLVVDFQIEEGAYEIPQLTIIASRDQLFSKVPGSVSYVSGTELKLLNPITTNEAFRRVSGVHVVDEEGAGLRANIGVRGLDPDRSRNVLIWYVGTLRHPLRNEVIVMLSVRAGLRAKEIACLTWSMITDADGDIGSSIHLTDKASKGRSGRVIPLNMQLRLKLIELFEHERQLHRFDIEMSHVIRTERSHKTSPQAVVNMFASWFEDMGLNGCSSHSGRRTFITNAAKKISSVGGSLRDVQMLAGHSSLAVTQRYIEGDGEARVKVFEII